MGQSKINAYIGFCLRARKITLGAGGILALKKGVYLIIFDGTAAKNTVRLAEKCARSFSCPAVVCKSGFGQAVNREGCRIAAITDESLSRAILENIGGEYELFDGGRI